MRGKQSDDLHLDFRPGKALFFHTVTMGGEVVPNLQLVPLRQVLADNCHMGITSGDMPSLCQRQCASGEKFIVLRIANAQRLCVALILRIGRDRSGEQGKPVKWEKIVLPCAAILYARNAFDGRDIFRGKLYGGVHEKAA